MNFIYCWARRDRNIVCLQSSMWAGVCEIRLSSSFVSVQAHIIRLNQSWANYNPRAICSLLIFLIRSTKLEEMMSIARKSKNIWIPSILLVFKKLFQWTATTAGLQITGFWLLCKWTIKQMISTYLTIYFFLLWGGSPKLYILVLLAPPHCHILKFVQPCINP